jgi:hypothetical protein
MQFAAMPAPAADGSYTFVFEHSGTLSLLATRDRKHIVMALGRMPVSDDETFIRRFFMGAALEALTSGPLHAGIAPDGACYYATVIAGEEFDLPTLESNLNQLFAAHEAVA